MTLAIALELREQLRKELPGVEVLLTRESDEFLALGERTRRANQARGQLFVSLHINAAKDRRARGNEVYFLRPGMNEYARQVALRENAVLDFEGPDARGQRPAEDWILASMAQSGWAEESRGVAQLLSRQLGKITEKRRRPVQQAGFQVLVGASMPSVLVECGFLSNAEDHRQLSSREGQRELARALAAGLRELHDLSQSRP
jgi:N-acetylmuramoyl-L-alanine amidase